MEQPNPTPAGCVLMTGNLIVRSSYGYEHHLQKLPDNIRTRFQNHADCGQAAMDMGDWMTAANELELCHEMLKEALYHKLIDLAVFDWLLVWVNASLADVYQFCLRKFSEYRFVELREDMVEIVEANLRSNNNCEALDLVNVVKKSLCTAMYEFWAYASLPSDAKEKENAIKSFAILTGLPEDECESELCQLLSLNHASAGNNEDALQWVRKAKTLWTEKFPGRVNYDILRMEANMLYHFNNVEEAIVILKDVSAAMESMPLERGYCSDPKPKGFNLNNKKGVHDLLSRCYGRLRQRAAADGELSKAKQYEEGSVQELQEADKILDSDEMREIELLIKDADEHMTNCEFEKAIACSLECLSRSSKLPLIDKFTAIESCQMLYECFRKMAETSNSTLTSTIQSSNANAYLTTTKEVLFHGQRAANLSAEFLYGMKDHTESWISMLEKQKHVYRLLQEHHILMYHVILHSLNGKLPINFTDTQVSALLERSIGAALLWAERERTRALLFQLGSNKLSTLATKQLFEFDCNDEIAWKALKSSQAACGPRTVILEYSCSAILVEEIPSLDERNCWLIYAMNDLSVKAFRTKEAIDLEKRLKRLRSYLSQLDDEDGVKGTYDDESMNEDLEFLHELLISPVAELLKPMRPEDKLIIIPHELLTNVPFAALRDHTYPAGKGYLVQRHTISISPSLRVLQHCSERLKALEQNSHNIERGAIVAVGDPAYGSEARRLRATGEEVKFIAGLLDEKYVVKLLETDATPAKVLDWAKYPSDNSLKQIVFHIGAHGTMDTSFSKGALMLAKPNAKPYPPDSGTPQDKASFAGARDINDAGDSPMEVMESIEGFVQVDTSESPKLLAGVQNGEDDDDAQGIENEDCLQYIEHPQEATEMSHGEVGGISRSCRRRIGRYERTLKSEDISGCGFEWRAHMVVLSACDTSRGEITAEGVLNLPRALMVVGVPCVVVSQWQVDDWSTCELMKGFYMNLKKGQDVASSLRGSMVQMLDDEQRKVCEWAPFVVCGLPTVTFPLELQS
ncbi:hypothetical protein BDL97_11G086900 [Sphagnum fallax]|nr:hypothetical protein BDL97_11G086900 [Sphagnum fallax]